MRYPIAATLLLLAACQSTVTVNGTDAGADGGTADAGDGGTAGDGSIPQASDAGVCNFACTTGQFCATTGDCVDCLSDVDCKNSQVGTHCDTRPGALDLFGTCVECLVGSQCGSGMSCSPANDSCVPTCSDASCSAGSTALICDPQSGTCVDCLHELGLFWPALRSRDAQLRRLPPGVRLRRRPTGLLPGRLWPMQRRRRLPGRRDLLRPDLRLRDGSAVSKLGPLVHPGRRPRRLRMRGHLRQPRHLRSRSGLRRLVRGRLHHEQLHRQRPDRTGLLRHLERAVRPVPQRHPMHGGRQPHLPRRQLRRVRHGVGLRRSRGRRHALLFGPARRTLRPMHLALAVHRPQQPRLRQLQRQLRLVHLQFRLHLRHLRHRRRLVRLILQH